MKAEVAQKELQYNLDFFEIADMITSATDLSSNCIEYHEKRVAYIAKRIFETSYRREAPAELILAALLHDIGIDTCAIKKNLLQLFPEEGDMEKHSIDGENLLRDVDLFSGLSGMIRNHHRSFDIVSKLADRNAAILSNIINLADRIDVSIHYNENILLQVERIIGSIMLFPEGFFHKDILAALLVLSSNKSFWLDINNTPLIDSVVKKAISKKLTIGTNEISQITDLCAKIIDRKSPYTARHSFGVSIVAERIGRLFNMDEERCFMLSTAGKLHDIGKLSVPEDILHKPSGLDRDEFRIIQQHTYYTYYLMNKVSMFEEIKKWAAYHHENLDGSGYPFSVRDSEISIEARIISVADKLIALTEDRPYRVKKQKSEVLGILSSMVSRNHIDMEVVNMVAENYEGILEGV